MDMLEDARYRLRLAEGYLDEARQDVGLTRWRSCVGNCQLAVENAAKAALALLGPLGRTHNPAPLLREAITANRFPPDVRPQVQRLADAAGVLGPPVHVSTDYGDEDAHLTPWELFGETDATSALTLAEDAVALAQQILSSSAP